MMVERYLSRRMSGAEEVEFRRRLGTDPELRAILETEQTIQRTLYRDRDALPAVSAESRYNVLTMLGRLAPAESSVASGAAG
ncbi:MAG: hypothetical protein JWQ98_122 [Chlorobi bacterium]|nr:hypothetical protein [Chlorobiota bacterium]